MLYNKESAIAAIAIMLVAAPFLGGLVSPAFAEEVARRTVSKGATEDTTIGAVEFNVRKQTLMTQGELIVSIVQNGTERGSTSLETTGIDPHDTSVPVVAEFDNAIQVTDDFDVVIEFEGSGGTMIVFESSIQTINGTQTAGSQNGGSNNGGTNGGQNGGTNGGTQTAQSVDLTNEFLRKTISLSSSLEMDVTAVEFSAKKQTLTATGEIIVAIVQGNNVLGSDEISADATNPNSYTDLEAEFDLTVTGSFDVVFMHEGRGSFLVNNVNVPGPTSPASNPGNGNGGTGSQTDVLPNVILTVEAEDEDGNDLSMFMTVWQDFTSVASGLTPLEVDLPDGEYTVQAHDFDDETTDTHIHFLRWHDSSQDEFRFANLTNHDTETFTAIYSADGSTGTSGTGGTGTNSTGGTGGTGGSGDMTVEAGQIGIRSVLLDGTEVPGFQVQLRDTNGDILDTQFTPAVFDDVEPGQRIVMYSANNHYFRSWSDNGLHRYHVVEADDLGTVMTARYENVPADQDAHLIIIAKTADGEIIGGTTGTDTDGTLSATPGLEVTVAPPNTMTPYTAGFTGGSEIQEHFFFFDGQTYTIVIQEFPPYSFSHWEDNPSFTNRARVVDLNGDTTLVAIFNES